MRPFTPFALSLTLAAVLLTTPGSLAQKATIDHYVALVAGSAQEKQAAWQAVSASFAPQDLPILLDVLHLSSSRQLRQMANDLIRARTGEQLGPELDSWYQWLWSKEDRSTPERFADFKSQLWRLVDPKFAGYFGDEKPLTIQLDEVRWGGVGQDGIPPLRDPKLVTAKKARFLDDSNVVFGIEINGEARAYPKRILAWHEMVTETVGGVPIAGVYCTLCGTMIIYETEVDGVSHDFGTSGFLYRSNKLMYDRATQSLWNTLWGTPVIGPLVDQNVTLPRRSIVTTTWGEWRKRHPDTMVVSKNTGHDRDYSEGAAYREYFATDELMFTVQHDDDRLANKAEVFGLVFDHAPMDALALSADFLAANPLWKGTLAGVEMVVLTDASGANRAYRADGVDFASWDGGRTVRDADGGEWTLSEDELTGPEARTLERLPSQRAFWFGWRAAFPDTRLVK